MSHGSGWPLTQVNVRIKIVIIIVLKPDSGVDLRSRLDHKSTGSTKVDQS